MYCLCTPALTKQQTEKDEPMTAVHGDGRLVASSLGTTGRWWRLVTKDECCVHQGSHSSDAADVILSTKKSTSKHSACVSHSSKQQTGHVAWPTFR